MSIPIFTNHENTTEQVPSTATEITIGEPVPTVEGAFQNTEVDPHLELKKQLKELYPELDAFQFDCVINIHEALVKIHGNAYTEEQYLEYVKEHSKDIE